MQSVSWSIRIALRCLSAVRLELVTGTQHQTSRRISRSYASCGQGRSICWQSRWTQKDVIQESISHAYRSIVLLYCRFTHNGIRIERHNLGTKEWTTGGCYNHFQRRQSQPPVVLQLLLLQHTEIVRKGWTAQALEITCATSTGVTGVHPCEANKWSI